MYAVLCIMCICVRESYIFVCSGQAPLPYCGTTKPFVLAKIWISMLIGHTLGLNGHIDHIGTPNKKKWYFGKYICMWYMRTQHTI